MKKSLIIIFLFAAITLAGCKERCNPAFPPTLVDYFPYVIGDEYKFMTGDQERTLVFTVNDVKVSEEECFPWNCKCSAPGYMCFIAYSDAVKVTGDMEASDGRFHISTCIIDEQAFAYEMVCDPFAENAHEVIGDTILLSSKKSGNKCVVLRGKGLVEVEYGNETWCLIE